MEQKKHHAYSPAELQQDLHDIEEKLKKPVDQKTMRELFQKLEMAQEDCSLMKTKYTFSAEKFLAGFEEKIRSLFGTVVTTHVDTEVEDILHKAHVLSSEDLAAAQALRSRITALKSWHRPCKDALLKLIEAEQKLNKVPPFLSQAEAENDPLESINLLQLASFVYHKNKEERNKLYCSLSELAKERFQKHLTCLKTKPFEQEETTIQALFVSAFELAGIPAEYPSFHEIAEFFSNEECSEK